MMKILNFFIDLLKKALSKWYSLFVALPIVTVIFVLTIPNVSDGAVNGFSARRLEILGMLWILAGALWTSLGTHMDAQSRSKLEGPITANPEKMAELLTAITGMLKASSNFSTYGTLLILAGTALTLISQF